jgi:fibrillarin-like pre-rRNA processing protein
MEIRPRKKFSGIFCIGNKFATVNLVSGKRVYGEELITIGSVEYRVWDYYRSKPAAAIKRGLKILPVEPGMKILYLGIASGTTASHFSDIIGKEGIIYGVDISNRVLRELLPLAEARGNIIPILADARKPETYESMVLEKVDVVYEDVASPDQIKILIRNAEKFLKPGGRAAIAIKPQSIDVTKDPRTIYKECLKELEEYFTIEDKVELDPYERAHLFVVMKGKFFQKKKIN